MPFEGCIVKCFLKDDGPGRVTYLGRRAMEASTAHVETIAHEGSPTKANFIPC